LLFAAFALTFVIGANAALPETPLQHAPWQSKPVAGIPDYVAQAVSALFNAGLADPRGGEYRQVEFNPYSAPGGSRTLNGWYFPEGFAVGWDGLVHRGVRAGERVDLSADVAAAKAKFWREGLWTAPPDAEFVGVALLLRLGEGELARQLLAKIPANTTRGRLDWFEVAEAAWLSGAYHQTVEAHFVGDNRLTIDIGEMLIGARAAFESEWTALRTPGSPDVRPLMAFLAPVPTLIEDSQRRLKELPHPPLDRKSLAGMKQPERIAALIDRLEDVSEQQISQPGRVPIMRSSICKTLAEEGAAAVDPMIEVLDHDKRLTHSFGFGRNFAPERYVISVAGAAEEWLEDYYHLHPFRWKDPAERRAWLVQNKFRTQAERAFDLLAGDKNDEAQWLDGAQILLSVNKNGPGLLGDALRDRRDPSVSELLDKRVAQSNTNWGNDLSLLLFQWDPPASIQALRRQAAVWRSNAGAVVAALLQLGDSSTVSAWAAGIRGDQVANLEQLAPVWTAPEQEAVLGVARKLFIDPTAPMSPTAMLAGGRCPDDLIRSPLLISPTFRESIFQGLARNQVIGSVTRVSGSEAKVTGPCGFSTGYAICGRSSRPLHQPGTQQIRIADSIAYSLSMICGVPEFDLEATDQQRDQAIAAVGEFLRVNALDLRAPALTASTQWWDLKVSVAAR
jgi:hypothetical protein